MENTQHETELITTRVESGILIVKIELNSLMHEMVISQIESCIMEVLPRAKTSLLVDCSELQLHVSSQFLSSLMCVYRNANARGTKLAVCNLSSTLKAGYKVTALTTLIPAFDSVEQAIEELRKLQAREIARPGSRRESFQESPSEPIRLSRATLALLGFAFLFFCSAAFMLGTILGSPVENKPLQVPFETSITGTITQAGEVSRAWVVAWPEGYQPQSTLTAGDLAKLAKKTVDWSSMLSVTATNLEGKFELPVRGVGRKTGLNVLVVSTTPQQESREFPADDARRLAGVIAQPKSLLESRRYLLMTDLEIRPHAITDYRWQY